ncbi:L-serine ammonia-lyase [Acidipila sp. EB88]|uniref:L-serine ammonia-lyase n=1 Tax=Acidipila sp. EB88 TaxID=2305226 RepID=UPI000F5F0FA5|nr:L-serine ammonia-lyase [Acidipila sp. EB88]RRA48653.1 L-serine ammonia-lyase [Acidipila sp. EB88]
MKTSFFDLFKPGIGPSSSHTMGPMRAARTFALELEHAGMLPRVRRIAAELYGSLALTGKGHGTDRAVLLGLLGEEAATTDPDGVDTKLAEIAGSGTLRLLGKCAVPFVMATDLRFFMDTMLPPNATSQHPNGMRFVAEDDAGAVLLAATYFSIGGGFIVHDGEDLNATPMMTTATLPFPFASAEELLAMAETEGLTIAELMFANECSLRPAEEVRAGVLHVWATMRACMDRGMAIEGILPGGLNVRRRAARLQTRLRERVEQGLKADPLAPLDWVTVYAMAVNEENAAGGRVVTAPTNGAAGVVPAVGRYYLDFIEDAGEDGIVRYLLTAAAIGVLYKENASISGAEVGCQGEVGVACSMAAGGLVAALGGTNNQVEHAAEIGMEHNLGMTCDPIGGLVQIPCIERNAMGAVKAVQACRISMHEADGHKVSLDQVIRTMYLTGLDMQSRYKETSLAGLALNIIEC